ncbi:hypothetical protein Bca52824_011256 [Brassica carinata]|uniref:Uncharacterized protein n=1 Tax=Brassica carinata TaxID=52824 RepID=A0A8X7WHQ6_BRACI|nr:hypothetical protein Bca52824_011256 [Brassica carinata]
MAASIDSREKTVGEDDRVGGDDEAAPPPPQSPVSQMDSELKIVVDVVEAKKELDLVPSSLHLSLARHMYSLECEATMTEQIKFFKDFVS